MRALYLNSVVIILIVMALSSCGSIFSGGSPEILLEGRTNEPVTISTSKNVYYGVHLPMEVKVKRHGLEGQRIHIESDNYTYPDIVLDKRVNKITYANILLGGIIGWSVDLATNCVAVPKQKSFLVTGTPKQSNTSNAVETIIINNDNFSEVIPTTTGQTTSSSAKSFKNYAQQVEGVYLGVGKLTLNNQTIEEYEDIKVFISRKENRLVGIQVQESNGTEFFYSPLDYQVIKNANGNFDLNLVEIPSAIVTISKDGELSFIHPKIDIEGKTYQLTIHAMVK